MSILLSILAVIGSLFALYQSIRNAILNRDISQASKKESLLQTVIDAKNMSISEDEKKVKETGDKYEESKRSYDSNINKPK